MAAANATAALFVSVVVNRYHVNTKKKKGTTVIGGAEYCCGYFAWGTYTVA